MSNLLPCPFCGCDMSGFAGMTPDAFAKAASNNYAVECDDCECFGPFKPTMEEAVAAWNTRAAVSAPGDRR